MKNIFLLVIFFALVSATTFAQKLTKEEKALQKEWEKRKKAMKPEEFKALVEQKKSLEEQLVAAERELQENEKLLNQKTAEIINLRNRISELEKAKEQQSIATASLEDEKGTFYKVQLFLCDENPDAETSRKYTLGRFNTLAEAQRFQKSLQKMQVNAKIVTYKNGKASVIP
jgi:septal ring factor EnvC (AmiA/AmiB activator)